MRGSLPQSSEEMPLQQSAPDLVQPRPEAFVTGADGSAGADPSAGRLATLRRSRLEEAISGAVRSGRTTVVSAPAGYGKTTLLGDWSRSSDEACAWLTVGRSVGGPAELYRGIVLALHSAAAGLRAPARGAVLGLDPQPRANPREDHDRVIRALGGLTEPLALVIDDLHRVGPWLDHSLLGSLLESRPDALHLVLSSRGGPALPLAAARMRGAITDLGPGDLAFTLEETGELLSIHGFDGPAQAPALWKVTDGWPVALAEAMALGAMGRVPADAFCPEPRRVFLAYASEEVLADCPAPLADFILRATTRDTIDCRLAVELGGDAPGSQLLEECLEQGFLLEQDRSSATGARYSWQPLFAAACRTILSHRDPQLARTLHGIAARHFQDVDVRTCVLEALLGDDPRTAMNSIGEHWLEVLMTEGAASLEQLCLRLPFPWSEDPEMLLVRSACRAIEGDQSYAAVLGRRASSGLMSLGTARRRRFTVNRELFELFVLGSGDRESATREGYRIVDLATRHPAATLTDGLFLVGRAETRSFRPGKAATDLLQAATAAGSANGSTTIEQCAGAELALALSVQGDFAAAEEQGAAVVDRSDASSSACRRCLAPVWLARGLRAYWQDDLTRADRDLAEAADAGCGPFPVDSLGVVYRVLVACATGDPARITAAELALRAVDAHERHDSSWPTLARVAAAKLREAAGDHREAAALAKPLARGGVSPLADVLLAEVLRKAGEPEAALACLEALGEEANPAYVEASAAVTEVLIADAAGESGVAHERLEYAVACADPESVLRPFVEHRADLVQLLVQHAAWGTAHDAFIASALAHQPPDPVRRRQRDSWTLSEREREVLSYLRTMLTVAEIADSLFISVNTLKTHQQSIYRKLGATNRRSAIRIAMARGLV